jgi:hypothetical protein
VEVGPNETIFLANGVDGLNAFTFHDTSFTYICRISDGGAAEDIEIGTDGTIFLANSDDGLRAYTFDGANFTNIAHIDDGGSAEDVTVGPDGTIFVANEDDGLRAYEFSLYTTIDKNNGDNLHDFSLFQNYPNPFNSSTKITYRLHYNSFVRLEIFDITGKKVKSLVDEYQLRNHYQVTFDANNLASGIYIYRLQIDKKNTYSKKMVLIR